MVKVGLTTFSRKQVVENIVQALDQVVDKIPKKWGNVQALYLRTADSVALPFYNSLPTAQKTDDSASTTTTSKPTTTAAATTTTTKKRKLTAEAATTPSAKKVAANTATKKVASTKKTKKSLKK
jgi:ribosome biogenesis protein UTP30